MHKRQNKQPIGARGNPHPVIGDRIIARANGINADHFGAAGFDFTNAHFNRIAVVIFCHTKQHEQLGVIPVGLAEFPKGSAHGVNACSGHIHAAKPAMRGIIGGAKILRPETGKGLRLITTCKECQLFGFFFTHRLEQADRHLQRFIPADFFKFSRATWPHPFERRAQTGRRIDLHDAGAALGAQNALVDRVIAVALDIGNLSFFHMDIYAAPTGAHVTGCFAYLV